MEEPKTIKFSFSDQQREKHAQDLSKSKPRLPAGRIKFFLSECEREINWCMAGYPSGWRPEKKTPDRLQAVADAAIVLMGALQGLSETERPSLFSAIIMGHDCGYGIREMEAEYRELNSTLLKIHQESNCLIHGVGSQISQRFSDEFAGRIAVAYVTAFASLPSSRTGSIYAEFIEEVACNNLPQKWRPPSLGWRTLRAANIRASIHLEAVKSVQYELNRYGAT